MPKDERFAKETKSDQTDHSQVLMIDWNSLLDGIKLLLVVSLFGWVLEMPFGSVSKLWAKLNDFRLTRRMKRQLRRTRRK
jgi:hypothetical protein